MVSSCPDLSFHTPLLCPSRQSGKPGHDHHTDPIGTERGNQAGPKVIKLFFVLKSTAHETYHAHKCKMPTIFSLKARKLCFSAFFYEQLKFHAQLN